MKKSFSKTNLECKVTFQIPAEILGEGKKVCVAGDFNNWNVEENPLKITKGIASGSITLPVGKEFQYKFVIDGNRWENDAYADKYVSNEYGEANSIVETYK